ncbi:helix-turn-helix domain-containing protein [Bacteroidales bacterium MSK.15.36]|nr:helix-turn-helix domain-containing protein [Bacteroidales bacterium MSK.15.36]
MQIMPELIAKTKLFESAEVTRFAYNWALNKQKLNWIRLCERERISYGEGVKYINSRVSFDGLNWWISVGIEY